MRIDTALTAKTARMITAASPSGSPHPRFRNPDGSVVFKLDNVEVPEFLVAGSPPTCWRRNIFRKAGVPARLKKVEENSVPSFLWRSGPPTRRRWRNCPEKERTWRAVVQAVFDRLAGTWTYWGWGVEKQAFDRAARMRSQ